MENAFNTRYLMLNIGVKCIDGSFKSRFLHIGFDKYRAADKSLARSGRKQAAPVKSVMGRRMD